MWRGPVAPPLQSGGRRGRGSAAVDYRMGGIRTIAASPVNDRFTGRALAQERWEDGLVIYGRSPSDRNQSCQSISAAR
jgi:hypothetical protein